MDKIKSGMEILRNRRSLAVVELTKNQWPHRTDTVKHKTIILHGLSFNINCYETKMYNLIRCSL